jgi:hypothetical protein
MAPDGVRALLVMHSAAAKQNYVETATVQTTNGGKQMMLGEFQPLRLQLTNITDAAWDKQGIIVIGTDKAAPQPWLVSTDGSSLQLLPGSAPGFVPEHVASNTHKDTLPVIQDDAGHIHWLSKDLGWVSMNDDDSEATIKPTYPG